MIAGDETNKSRLQRVSNSVISLENCPTCKQKVGADHKHSIKSESEKEILEIDTNLSKNKKERTKIDSQKREIIQQINLLREKDRNALMRLGALRILGLKEKIEKLIKSKNRVAEN